MHLLGRKVERREAIHERGDEEEQQPLARLDDVRCLNLEGHRTEGARLRACGGGGVRRAAPLLREAAGRGKYPGPSGAVGDASSL